MGLQLLPVTWVSIVPTYSIASTCHTLTANIPIKLKVFSNMNPMILIWEDYFQNQ
jgi:hypothetical protein